MASKKKKKSSTSSPRKLLILLTTLGLILLGYLYYQTQQNLANPTPLGINEISTPTSPLLTFRQASPNSVELVLDPQSLPVTASQISLTYDPAQLGSPSVKLGEFFPNLLGKVTASNGKLTFIGAVNPDSHGRTQPGLAATITFTQSPIAETTLSLTSDTIITAAGYDTNLFSNPTSLTLRPASTPTPTATPTATPTPTPKPSLTPTPTPKPSVTVIPKASITPTPKPTNKPRSSFYTWFQKFFSRNR